MQRSQFFYSLPQELIAQQSVSPRDRSRLLCLHRETGKMEDRFFYEIGSFLHPGDLVVVNDSKVIPARLKGHKTNGGGAVELLLLHDAGENCWECMVKPGRRLRPGAEIEIGWGALYAEIRAVTGGGNRLVHFEYDKTRSFFSLLDEVGEMPLPHYIERPIHDAREYQTIYAEREGSSAAPTAGFHFTEHLMDEIRAKGVRFAPITLHVGLGTFRPVKEDVITDHHMHAETYSISEETASAIRQVKSTGGRVFAVGTTTCRALEATAQKHGEVVACTDSTDIFIYPGFRFGVIDALITNFHLPESTLIMLVSAFAGYVRTMEAYRHAVDQRYRFYSFGDAMLIDSGCPRTKGASTVMCERKEQADT